MSTRYTARIVARCNITGQVVMAAEVTCPSKFQCKKILKSSDSITYYQQYSDLYTVSKPRFTK